MELKWYVVHTYSGFENRAKKALEESIKQKGLDDHFGEIMVPTENVMEIKKGEKRTRPRKYFPGYILIKMLLTKDTWHVVKNTPKVTGFVGGGTNPPPVPEEELLRITRQIDEGTLKPRHAKEFSEGENVRVIEGPFQNFNGVVEEVNTDKGRLRVLVSIFGRSTPVELEYSQVEKN